MLCSVTASRLLSLQVATNLARTPLSHLQGGDSGPLTPTIQKMIYKAEKSCIEFTNLPLYKICVGGLEIRLSVSNNIRHFQESLEWLTRFDDHIRDVPYSLSLYHCRVNIEHLKWLSTEIKVTRLSLRSGNRIGDTPTSTEETVQFLSTRSFSHSFGWLLPHLEAIQLHLEIRNGRIKPDLTALIKNRRSESLQSPYKASAAPTGLRKLRLSHSPTGVPGPNPDPVTNKLLSGIEAVGKGLSIYWQDRRWFGSVQ
ncbi:hypothetical protein FRB90_009330 [Tulasnella sp. 427]|nr:hypothetical protein FRB90_009330 [Tulasnella sp. 427]